MTPHAVERPVGALGYTAVTLVVAYQRPPARHRPDVEDLEALLGLVARQELVRLGPVADQPELLAEGWIEPGGDAPEVLP